MEVKDNIAVNLDNKALDHYTDNLRAYIDDESADKDIQEATIDYVTELLELQAEKKLFMDTWNDKLVSCKKEATDRGVEIARANAVIENIKRKLKQPEDMYQKESQIYEMMVVNNLAEQVKDVI